MHTNWQTRHLAKTNAPNVTAAHRITTILSKGGEMCMDTPLPMEQPATKMLGACMLPTFDNVVFGDSISLHKWLDPMTMAMGKHHVSITAMLASSGPVTTLQMYAFNLRTPDQQAIPIWPPEVLAITSIGDMAWLLNSLLSSYLVTPSYQQISTSLRARAHVTYVQ